MSKYTLEIELEDKRFCDGCPKLCYDRCLYLDILLSFENEYICNYIRPPECPLNPVLTQQPTEIPHIEFETEGVQTC